MKTIAIITATIIAVFGCSAASANSGSKTIDMETMHLTRAQNKFGPLNATLNIAYIPQEKIATYIIRYAMTAGRNGQVYQRSTRFGDTNGPWMSLQLVNKSGAIIAEKTHALAPVWECNTTTRGDRMDTISVTKEQYSQIAGFKLVQTSAWREVQCL